MVGIGPYMGFNFAIYDGLKRLTNEHSSHISLKDKQSALGQVLNVMKNGLCGALAGGTSKLLVYPLDTVKRRMQIQVLKNTLVTAAATPTYSSAWNCLSNTLKSEGIQGLYKVNSGLFPINGSLLKNAFRGLVRQLSSQSLPQQSVLPHTRVQKIFLFGGNRLEELIALL